MKLIPFDLERALAGDAVVTRDGRKIMEIMHFRGAADRFRVYARADGDSLPSSYYENGRVHRSEEWNWNADSDLFMAPKTKTYWANVYSAVTENPFVGKVYEHKGMADSDGLHVARFIKTISFEAEE